MRAEPGQPEPLGVTSAAGGANVAVWSRHATAIELCVFAGDGDAETARIRLPARTADVFHGFVRGLEPGQADGRWRPAVAYDQPTSTDSPCAGAKP